MYQNCCKKCGSTSLHTEIKGNNTGLYCNDCGSYIKWLSKSELRAYEYSMRTPTKEGSESVDIHIDDISKLTGTNTNNEKTMVDRLNEFVKYLNKKIDSEYEKAPISTEDAIRKNSYCLALQQDIWALQNILNGKDFDYMED